MATIGLSKVFILDKYFTELQKFWETERKVQGIFSLFVVVNLMEQNCVSGKRPVGMRLPGENTEEMKDENLS